MIPEASYAAKIMSIMAFAWAQNHKITQFYLARIPDCILWKLHVYVVSTTYVAK